MRQKDRRQRETERKTDRQTERQTDKETKIQKYRKTEDRETERKRDIYTGDRETGDRETERKRDREEERQRERRCIVSECIVQLSTRSTVVEKLSFELIYYQTFKKNFNLKIKIK